MTKADTNIFLANNKQHIININVNNDDNDSNNIINNNDNNI